MNNKYYTYHHKGILVPKLINYNKLKSRITYNAKKCKSSFYKQYKLSFMRFINTLVYNYNTLTPFDILHILNDRMSIFVDDFSEEIKLTYINNAFKNMNNIIIDKKKYLNMETEHFIWNQEELNKLNLNKEELKKFKKSIKIKHNIKTKEENKNEELKKLILLNKDYIKNKKQLYNMFNEYSEERINKICFEIGLNDFMSDKDYLLYNSFIDLFKNIDSIKVNLTLDNIIKLFNNKVSLITLKRFLKKYPEIKDKLNKIKSNNKEEENIKNDIKEEWTEQDDIDFLKEVNINDFLDDEDFLEKEQKKILNWDEYVNYDDRFSSEWTEQDDLDCLK